MASQASSAASSHTYVSSSVLTLNETQQCFEPQGISFIPDRGFAPFKIMYLMLGSLAIAVGISVLLFMPDSPTNAQFLTQEERIAAIERIRDQQSGTENKRLKKEQVLEALLDIKTWLIVLATLLSTFVLP